MDTEIEATFTNVKPEEVRKRLVGLGAEIRQQERLMRRRNYDFPDGRLEKMNGWVRLRDEGDKTTLAYKQLDDRTISGMKEVSVTVDDFGRTDALLTSIGLEPKSYQETKRESWTLNEVEVEIDTWPWIPPFVEIEGRSEEEIKHAAEKLGFDWSAAKHGSVENIYQEVYDVTEAEVDAWDTIVFSPVPKWLEAKRR